MLRFQKLDNEDNTWKDPAAKNLESTIQCIPITSHFRKLNPTSNKTIKPIANTCSDGNIIKNPEQIGLKQKLVNKVKSWSNRESRGPQNNKSMGSNKQSNLNIETIKLDSDSPNIMDRTSEEDFYKSDLLKAKDSLESLRDSRKNKTVSGDATKSKSKSLPSTSNEKHCVVDGPLSDTTFGVNGMDTITKVLAWDPWNKMGRKGKRETKTNKKEPKKRKSEKATHSKERKSVSSHSKTKKNQTVDDLDIKGPCNEKEDTLETYDYRSYQSGDEIIMRGTEPLKKGLDQQIRNKEMRRGHIPCTLTSKKQFEEEMWLRK